MAPSMPPRLLLLCHRIPYPPDKGDKIRSWRWLGALAGQYRVTLAAFVDDPADFVHRDLLARHCERLLLLPLDPLRARLRSLPALLTGAALSVRYYRDRRLRDWLAAEQAREPFAGVFVYSSAMAQYVDGPRWAGVRRVVDFVDVDSDKWQQYAARARGPMALIYRREARRLLAFDAAVAHAMDLSLFVSDAEAALFQARLAAVGAAPVALAAVPNGVDGAFFAPDPTRPSPYPGGVEPVVFTGAMDYWANVDAVEWFAREVWPAIQAARPRARFHIVGARPVAAVAALAGSTVTVTGRVPDVRPYLQHARVVVAPLRIARGIQNKVLEGMAMARPVVTTSRGLEGLALRVGEEVLVADTVAGLSRLVIDVLAGGPGQLGNAARAAVLAHYDWPQMTARLVGLVAGTTPVGAVPEVVRHARANGTDPNVLPEMK